MALLSTTGTIAIAETSHSQKILDAYRVRGFSGENMSFLIQSDGKFSDIVRPGFNDSHWIARDSMADFNNRWTLGNLSAEKLFEPGVQKPSMQLFPHVLPSQDVSARYYVIRTSFDGSQINSQLPVMISHTSGYFVAIFVNGNLVGSNFPIQNELPTYISDPEFTFRSPYQLPVEHLVPGKNTLAIVTRSVTWPPNILKSVEVSQNSNIMQTKRFSELLRLGIPAMFALTGFVLWLFFWLMSRKNMQQLRYRDLSLLSFFGALTFAYLSGTFTSIPINIVYQRKLFSMFTLLFFATSLKIGSHCFQLHGIPVLTQAMRRAAYNSMIVAGGAAFIFTNGNDLNWDYIVSIQCAATVFVSASTIWAAITHSKNMTPALWGIVWGQAAMLIFVVESFFNYHFRYWNAFAATWGLIPVIVSYAYYYNTQLHQELIELDELRQALEQKVNERTHELERTSKRLRHTLIKARNMSSIIDQHNRFKEVATLSVHLDHQIRNPLAVAQLSLEELAEKIETSPHEAQLDVHKIEKAFRNIGTVLDSLRMFRRFGGEGSLQRQVAKRRRD